MMLLLTADQSYHLGMLGVPGLETPNIDALAKRGTSFTKAYLSGTAFRSCLPHDPDDYRNTVVNEVAIAVCERLA